MAKNRYIGEYPVIGIRPIVDGRRGPMQLRESLEDQVMAMAEAAKKLFEENLYYSNGEPVKVVMADTSIGRVPESAACAEEFSARGVAITLSVTPLVLRLETMDMDPSTIKGVWGFNGTERPGAVSLRPYSQRMRRRVCRVRYLRSRGAGTATRSRTSLTTLERKSCSASAVQLSPLLRCAVSPTSRSAR